MLLWETERGRKAFGTTPEFAKASKVLAANQGLYNGFLVAGLVWGIWLGEAGDPIKIFFLLCVAVAGAYGALTVGVRILLIQTLPALAALAANRLARGRVGRFAMWDFSIGRTLGLMGQTLPFLAFRMIVYFGIAVAFVLVTGVGVGVGWGIGAFGGEDFRAGSMFWGGLIGFGVTAGAIFFLREYILYIVKAGHIAVLVELLEGGTIPQGQGQIAYASEIVRQRFAETNVLFGIDLLVKG
eukprot:gene55295-75786_t